MGCVGWGDGKDSLRPSPGPIHAAASASAQPKGDSVRPVGCVRRRGPSLESLPGRDQLRWVGERGKEEAQISTYLPEEEEEEEQTVPRAAAAAQDVNALLM